MKSTLILGASSNPDRYSYMATVKLKKFGHKVYPVGIKEGEIEGEKILTNRPVPADLHTVTLYLGPKNQGEWYDYVISLNPKRIIFNPGTENPELCNLASSKGIECIEACTLVLLSLGDY